MSKLDVSMKCGIKVLLHRNLSNNGEKSYREPKFFIDSLYGKVYASKDGEVFIELDEDIRKYAGVKIIEFIPHIKEDFQYKTKTAVIAIYDKSKKRHYFSIKNLIFRLFSPTKIDIGKNKKNNIRYDLINKDGDVKNNCYENLEAVIYQKVENPIFNTSLIEKLIDLYTSIPFLYEKKFTLFGKEKLFNILKKECNKDLPFKSMPYIAEKFYALVETVEAILSDKPMSEFTNSERCSIVTLKKISNQSLSKLITYLMDIDKYKKEFENYLKENKSLSIKGIKEKFGDEFIKKCFKDETSLKFKLAYFRKLRRMEKSS